jgi:formylglycine-generating enzyme required for sulfatase activity
MAASSARGVRTMSRTLMLHTRGPRGLKGISGSPTSSGAAALALAAIIAHACGSGGGDAAIVDATRDGLAADVGPEAGVDDGEACGLLGRPCPTGFECTPLEFALRPNNFREFCYRSADNAVFVPPGPFWMGCNSSNPGDRCTSLNAPAVLVTTSAFLIQRTPVTVAQYQNCRDALYCDMWPASLEKYRDRVDWFWQRAVSTHSVAGAERYCSWLSLSSGIPWRLCSSAEWEKAARGGCETLDARNDLAACAPRVRLFPWGDIYNCSVLVSTSLCDYGDPDDLEAFVPVASRPAGAGPYGLLDMFGTNPGEEATSDCVPSAALWSDSDYPPRDGSAWDQDCGVGLDHSSSPPLEGKRRIMRGGGANFGDPATNPLSVPTSRIEAHEVATFRCCADFIAAP